MVDDGISLNFVGCLLMMVEGCWLIDVNRILMRDRIADHKLMISEFSTLEYFLVKVAIFWSIDQKRWKPSPSNLLAAVTSFPRCFCECE